MSYVTVNRFLSFPIFIAVLGIVYAKGGRKVENYEDIVLLNIIHPQKSLWAKTQMKEEYV